MPGSFCRGERRDYILLKTVGNESVEHNYTRVWFMGDTVVVLYERS